MTAKSFIYGLLFTFLVPWLALLAVPSHRMSEEEPPEYIEAIDGKSGVYVPKRGGNLKTGLNLYLANGCATCHTQLVRTTDAGSDMWRKQDVFYTKTVIDEETGEEKEVSTKIGTVGWAGKATVEGNFFRESRWWDYIGEDIAPIGYMRVGPDLANVVVRVAMNFQGEAENMIPKEDAAGNTVENRDFLIRDYIRRKSEEWFYMHLYNPRDERLSKDAAESRCDAHPEMFEEAQIGAGALTNALPIAAAPGHQWVPREDAKRLVSYLMTLDRDDELPQAASYKPKTEDSGKSE